MLQRVLFIAFCVYAASSLADDTVLKLYRPFGEVLDQAVPRVKKKLFGECATQSHLIVREDAWRCQANGAVYDPCFVKPGSSQKEALCPQSPWVGDSVAIEVKKPLNNQHHTTLDMSRAFPWAIELVNGEQCYAIEAYEFYDSMPIRYRCNNHNVLIGYVQRCKSMWSMLEKTPEGVMTVDFSRAWF